jgi:hypothetical protein
MGRLTDGYKQEKGTHTMHYIHVTDIPKGRRATYLRLVVADRPTKTQTCRVRFTVGGDQVNYPGGTSTKTSSLPTAKILFNSVVSTPNAKFMTADIKDFYLCTPMSHYEYMRIPVSTIPDDIFKRYDLAPLVHKAHVYVEIQRGMYGLPQAGRLANDALLPLLATNGYHQCEHTPGLFKHTARPVIFCLVVDDFGVQYVGKEHAQHLMDVIASGYKMTTDWTGTSHCGLSLAWDYDKRTVDLSMPSYVEHALQRFEHPKPTKAQDAPHTYNKPVYGAHQQFTTAPDTTDPLSATGTTRLQEIIGVLLYYGRAIDSMMLVALGTLSAAQSPKGTQATAKAATHLLNYAASHPDATIRYTASPMILHNHSDASYLSEAHARSRAGGYFFLSSDPDTDPHPPLNGAVHVISNIMPNVLASAAEAEVGALFHNGQEACPLCNTLNDMG